LDLRPHIGQGIWALIDKSMTGIYGFALLFLVIGRLPRNEYGLYTLVFAITNLGLLFNKAFILFPMTKFEAEGSVQPRLLGNTFIFSFLSMLFFGGIAYGLAPLLAEVFHAPELSFLLKLVPIALMGFFFRDFSLAFFQAHRRVKALVLLDAVYFLGVSGSFAVLNLTGNFKYAVQAVSAHIFFAFFSSLIALYPTLRLVKFDFRLSGFELKKIFNFGRFSLSMGIGEITFYQFDLMLIGKFFHPAMVALYNSAKMPFRLYSLLTQSLNLLILPGTSHLYALDRTQEVKSLYEKVIAYYWTLMLILNIALMILADELFFFIYGGRYPDAVPMFRIFLLFTFFEPVYNISMNIFYGMGRPEKAFRPLLIAVPIFLLLCIILIPALAGYGAVLSFGVAIMIMAVFLFVSIQRHSGISLKGIIGQFINIPARLQLIFDKGIKKV
jgi:O-antigen/teichoic acid export membrane protein